MTTHDGSAARRTPYVAAIDVGGTSIKSALVSSTGEQLFTDRRPTMRERGPDAVIDTVLDCATDLLASGLARLGHPPQAIGLACLGAVDESAGIALESGAIGWRNVALRSLVAERTALPVALGHDVRAGALAEARFGAGRNHDVFLFVAIGTGIGAALVLGGEPHRGARSMAGELGHIVIEPDGYACNCGARGCLEAEASGTAIANRYTRAAGTGLTAREVAARFGAGDAVASQVWRTSIDRLARGLSTAAALVDPEIIIVGGGVALAGELLFHPLRAAMKQEFRLGTPPPVLPAMLGDRAACLGAGILAWQLLGQRADNEEDGAP